MVLKSKKLKLVGGKLSKGFPAGLGGFSSFLGSSFLGYYFLGYYYYFLPPSFLASFLAALTAIRAFLIKKAYL